MTPRQQAARERRNRKLEAAYEKGRGPINKARDKILTLFEKKRRTIDTKYGKEVSKLQAELHRRLKPIDYRSEKLIQRTLDKRR